MSNSDERGLVFKVVVVGDGAVGKTSLIRRYTQGDFQKQYIQTLGAQFTNFRTEVESTPIDLIFWDIAGQEAYGQLRGNFYQGSSAAIIVFSQEDSEHGKKSLQSVSKWYDDIKKHCGPIPVILFGNKIDLINEDILAKNKDQVDILFNSYRFLGFYNTSALSGDGVNIAFEIIVKKLFEINRHII
ncbi:MAG: GTP-binding protein [Promethearchaeota archaeon]|nr:MAG: GTP-binding protein [Candidatus Lokiarchaeota archaeon]